MTTSRALALTAALIATLGLSTNAQAGMSSGDDAYLMQGKTAAQHTSMAPAQNTDRVQFGVRHWPLLQSTWTHPTNVPATDPSNFTTAAGPEKMQK